MSVTNRTIVRSSSLRPAGEDINVLPALNQGATQAGETWLRIFVRDLIVSACFGQLFSCAAVSRSERLIPIHKLVKNSG